MPAQKFAKLKETDDLRLAVESDCEHYLMDRLEALNEQLHLVDSLAGTNDLPDAILTDSGLKITPLDASVPPAAQRLIDQIAASLPHIKITDLLLEVDSWTGFTTNFTHLKSGDAAKDRIPLLTTILADAINMGLTKMAESCPGASYAKLSWLQAWHIRDETYSAALAELVNAQSRQPFAERWGDGTRTSSPRFIAARPTRGSHPAQVPLTARLGAHQPHRRLPVEGQKASNGQVQVAALPKPVLACFIVRFLTGPHC